MSSVRSVWCSYGRRQLACDALRIERAVEGARCSVAQLGLVGRICRGAGCVVEEYCAIMAPSPG
jgi:hypothetical protein